MPPGRKERWMGKKRRIALYTAAPALIFMITWAIFYKQTMLPKSSDIVAHMETRPVSGYGSGGDSLRMAFCVLAVLRLPAHFHSGGGQYGNGSV